MVPSSHTTLQRYTRSLAISLSPSLSFCLVLPGDYLQSHCELNSANCVPGEDRLPSCINLPDNNNPYPGKLDSEYYIKCYRNRTVSVEACQVSKYNPATRQCSENVSPGRLTETSQLLGPSGRARKNTSYVLNMKIDIYHYRDTQGCIANTLMGRDSILYIKFYIR